MNEKKLLIQEMARFPQTDAGDRLALKPGVNVLVGDPNTGKTKWLRMLDYVFGSDSKPEEAFGDDIAEKYESIRVVARIGGDEVTIERRWKEAGAKSKVFLGGKPLNIKDFNTEFMQILGMPIVHFPQGNPYGPRSWPELSWRSLYRHVYRRQDCWGDLADKQPEGDQHACLLLFLGLADDLFSSEYGDLVKKEKQIEELRSRRDQFLATLQDVSREILDEQELGVALTPQSIDEAANRIRARIDAIHERRLETLRTLVDSSTGGARDGGSRSTFEEFSKRLAGLQSEQEANESRLRRTLDRIAEMRQYRDSISEELARVRRALTAGIALAPLKVTHCPACDQPISFQTVDPSHCYVCGQFTDDSSEQEGEQRLNFEVEQLEGEVQEADELLVSLEEELRRETAGRTRIEEGITRAQSMLRPIREAVSAILPPEIALLDMETGSLYERSRQLERIRATLERREQISREIHAIEQSVAELEAQVAGRVQRLDFEGAGDALTDGMNTYLNSIKRLNPRSWTQSHVDFWISKNGFRVTVGGGKWSTKLGGTMKLYFLFAYHYALMDLTRREGRHYPGLAVLDLPAELPDGSTLADKENFVLEPFVELLNRDDMAPAQLVATGSAFQGLQGANRIELHRVWK